MDVKICDFCGAKIKDWTSRTHFKIKGMRYISGCYSIIKEWETIDLCKNCQTAIIELSKKYQKEGI